VTAPSPVLKLSGITKRFGALVANDDISLELGPGEVLGLLGENGAGKSTLVSILFGHYLADAGEIEAFGQPLPPGNPKAALAAGIGMVHQHFTLADNISVLDNVLLGTEPLWQPFSRSAAMRERLLATAQRFGLQVDPDARVGELSVGERQRVEILKALVRGARILILDEPTAVLAPQESESLLPRSSSWWPRACRSSSSVTSSTRCCVSATVWRSCVPAGWSRSAAPPRRARPSWPS
jgi:simple sugar transport system ATP-binding protein